MILIIPLIQNLILKICIKNHDLQTFNFFKNPSFLEVADTDTVYDESVSFCWKTRFLSAL